MINLATLASLLGLLAGLLGRPVELGVQVL